MIYGEIYYMNGCTFAYKEDYGGHIEHLICLNQDGEIKVKGVNGTGRILKSSSIYLASTPQKERFFNKMELAGFWYNKDNKAVFFNGKKVMI